MARLGCICGAEMTNTDAPSKNRINVFYMREAREAIRNNPRIRLWDFYSGWDEKKACDDHFQNREEPVEYWYCPVCRRVYEVQAQSRGKIVRAYAPQTEIGESRAVNSGMEELIVLTDIEMDILLSSNEGMLLSEYLNAVKEERWFISLDENTVYTAKNGGCISSVYKRER
uniref:hypothetical protein n=1 Tax=Eubacterium cellulosolvens TaxID=29322 RepID=UPI00047F2DF1|nr:hypothetical protein [[Eubacterium] cellulosolvens]